MTTTLTGKKILVTGPTGQVALPITLALANGQRRDRASRASATPRRASASKPRA